MERQPGTANRGECMLSVIIPAWRESASINALIDHIGRIDPLVPRQIIVVDGHPDGDTIAVIHDESVITLLSRQGRGTQMNRGASVARGEILLFLHADTGLPEGAFRKICSVMEKGEYAGGAFTLGIRSERIIFRIIEKGAFIRSWVTGIPYGDQGIFISRDVFEKIGGYSEIPLMEDVEIVRRIKKAGGRMAVLPDRVLTSPRRWEKEGVVYGTLRNWTLITLYSLGVSPSHLVKFYRS
ncbi:MAG TPA: TIGR04283 family arsenosugar biosynthesis glycosyltransferase [Dissulfurispiraceae bacterium]|nr:TIGR04283 family arsenosugar biosynthesis glycosyltransferase [Dissulfurispiraceae bacterium]